MKLDLFVLLYLSGYLQISVLQTLPGQYLITKAMTWPVAQNYCREMYTDLARVKDSSILEELSTFAADNGITSWPIWIGLYNDFNSWRWSFNNVSLTSLTYWSPGEPDNYHSDKVCVGIFGAGYWAQWNCATQRPFICYEAGKSGTDRFIGVTNPQLNWPEAQTYCRTFYTDLASSLIQADNDLLAQIVSVQGGSWFGLYRDTWKWLNRTVASNLQWNPGQPDNSDPLENCGFLQFGLFGNEECFAHHYFFCEFIPPIRQQIIKLEIRSDDNLFDDAVQLRILELLVLLGSPKQLWSIKARTLQELAADDLCPIYKVKLKLEQHGMLQNLTVTWKVQPDGNIFSKKTKN